MSKGLLIVLLLLVLGALFSGLYFLFHDHGKGERTLTALIFRIGFTVTLMIVLLISVLNGWITLHNL